MIENYETAGALKLLVILERDWVMTMKPKMPAICHVNFGDFNRKDRVPVETFVETRNNSMKKIFTDAMVRWLHDTGHMMRFLQGDVSEFYIVKVTKDKKGKITAIQIDIK